ncbi:unnamed protein product [Notodromas monacha]|uniref:Xylose isomerase-like TIM barrel domain-containing protein n=1 Tax=Notodromas monacha TaxID=399045 RepID=A0A7R9BR04_9CRUS|nr:unnamed protein product [Notodromas monacha]CAG0920054.1 unnamed protein product [Notodromas monacha]
MPRAGLRPRVKKDHDSENAFCIEKAEKVPVSRKAPTKTVRKRGKEKACLVEESNAVVKVLKLSNSEIKEEVDARRVGVVKAEVHLQSITMNGDRCSTGLKFMGAHVSAAGSIDTAVENAVKIGAKSFAMFLASQRQWARKPLDDLVAEKFRQALKNSGILPHLVLPHGSYLMNLGSPKPEILQKSRDLLVDELQRCEKLGITQFNLHPGVLKVYHCSFRSSMTHLVLSYHRSTCGIITRDECIEMIADGINAALERTKFVVVLLENMSRQVKIHILYFFRLIPMQGFPFSIQGYTIGGDFSELRDIIALIKDKTRIGVCFDTCHAFAAGYDVRTEDDWRKTLKTFDEIVGLQYLRAIHVNDSKGDAFMVKRRRCSDLGCRKDRHENIGKGKIGMNGFISMMNLPELNDIPLILETPWESDETYAREIKLLNSHIA